MIIKHWRWISSAIPLSTKRLFAMSEECTLVGLNGAYTPISLPHLQEIIIGRNPYCCITDLSCSRQQLSVVADLNKQTVLVKRIGKSLSGINGFLIDVGDTIPIEDGAYLEVVFSHLIYVVKFDPPAKKDAIPELTASSKNKIVLEPFSSSDLKRAFLNLGSDSLERECKLPKISNDGVSYCDTSIKKNNTAKPALSDTMEKIDNGNLYIFTSKGVVSQAKIAGYDIDGTIIKTKSGNVFPKSADDWQLAFPEVPGNIKDYHAQGYKIVFFTNQAGIGRGKITIEEFKRKIEKIIVRLGVPIQVFISSGKGFYRKPGTGMWDTLVHMKNDNLEIDINASFYCGDAAGRPKDHSMADRLFAENLGLKFSTPEAHYRGSKELPYKLPNFDPKLMDTTISNKELTVKNQEIVVMVGFPGSGKSSVSKQMEKTSKGRYKTVCRDLLNSVVKCQSEALKSIKNSQSIVVDSTNPDLDSRAKWISFASKNNLPCRCFIMDVTQAHAQHNNKYRQLTDNTHSVVKDVVYNMYKSKFKEPSLSEGFKEILKINFVPNFDNEQNKKLYYKHLLEK